VVGHGFGGMVAAELAANSPRRVDKLVLIAPFGLWRDENPIPDIAATPADEMPKLLLADPDGPLAAGLVPPADDPQALFEHAQRMASILHFIWPLPDKGLKRRLHRVRADTLLVWGREDRLVSPAYAADFAALLGKSQTAWIDGVGHLAQLEATDAVRDHTLAFLRS
jgi:pimeloyl-ACP methyl ester carboxylesterase